MAILDTNTQRETGRTAQINNIHAAKVRIRKELYGLNDI